MFSTDPRYLGTAQASVVLARATVVLARRSGASQCLAQVPVILARRSPTEKLSLELGARTCLVQKNNLNATWQYLWSSFRTVSPRHSWSSR